MNSKLPRTYTLDTIREGDSECFSVDLTDRMIEIFAELSGDRNPLHTESNFARSLGYKSTVAHGMLTASYYSQLVGMHLPGKHALFAEANVKFSRPVFAGDQLCIRGQVTRVTASVRLVEIKATIECNESVVSRAKLKTLLLK